jgi:class 3 adenylate cyclase/predicted ATPase
MSAQAGTSRRTVTVLFCDVVDSTPLGERLDAETLRRVLGSYFEAVRTVLERHGGTVEKFIGDAVMAVFGLPTLHEDDALRAIRAASGLRAAVAPLDEELARDHGLRFRLRAGVATGEVVAGDPGGGQSFATGETVVVAERLERAAQPSEVLVDDPTYRLTAGAAIVEAVAPVPAKGKAEPVAAWRLIGVTEGAPALARRLDTPLVGRQAELTRLRDAFDDAVRERCCRLMTVVGPAGIGKSRLTLELLDGLREEATVLVGHCLPYGDGITFWPVSEIFPEESFKGTTDEIFRRVRARIERLAAERPLVVCFEDIHWGEPTFLGLIEYLAGWIADSPVFLLCLARPDLLEQQSLLGGEILALAPLQGEEAGALLDALGAPAESRERIEEAAEGNPFFAEQMTAMALEEGPGFVVPASIRSLLAARLDRLTPEERSAIERAAVIGREFPLGAVAALSDGDVARPLLSLVRKELLRPDLAAFEDGFRFRHALIREAAYDAMPKALRAELHERHGRRLAERGAPDIVVGYHLEQAHLTRAELGPAAADDTLAREAGELLAAAGERAFRRDDIPAAANLLERALVLLRPDGPRLPELGAELASTLIKAGRLAEAERILDEALEAARTAGDRRSELRARVERQQLLLFTAPSAAEETARVAAETIVELEQLGDDLGLAKAWRLASEVHVTACRWGARTEALEKALEHAQKAPDARHETTSLMLVLSQALHYGRTPVQTAIAQCREFLREAGGPALQAGIGPTLAALLATQEQFHEARELYRQSATLQEELGLQMRRAGMTLQGGEIELLAGDLDAAERELRLGYEMLQEMGESGVRGVVAAYLAAVLLEQDKDEAAEQFVSISVDVAENDDIVAQILWRTTKTRLLVRRGEVERAESLAREALELASETDFPAMQADARVALANVLAHSGQDEAAQGLLEEARRIHEQKGNVAAAKRLAESLLKPVDRL